MITDRNKFHFVTICCWLSFLAVMTTTSVNAMSIQQEQQKQQQQKLTNDVNQSQHVAAEAFEPTRMLNPRMDYNNEWRPVGRGDPLKNDPTYDYSPPALERVRYWADSGDKDVKHEGDSADVKAAAGGKNDILLLGVSHERPRPSAPNALQNGKGELPLLQPKYTSVRRSYYAQQLPTRLMPPPMQTLAAASHNSVMKSAAAAAAGEYRHNMPTSFSASGSSIQGLPTHTKSFYSTMATSPWTHAHAYAHSHNAGPSTTTTTTMQHPAYKMPVMSPSYDSLHQESEHFLSYTRPSMTHTSEPYSPNSIHPQQNVLKTGSSFGRKPWVHELLQKEFSKPVRPTMPATKFLMGSATKPSHSMGSPGYVGHSPTFAPVKFLTTSTSTTTTTLPSSEVPKATTPAHISSPIYITTTAIPTTTTTRSTTTTQTPIYSATRLLIPETSNMAFRPTVAPMEMTTDSLFAHYNQPEKPLIGPMYLIIEGHSKVKTYGQNELDPRQPKIVPIIPKREPVVRIADPNDQRSKVQTFQVKHLHTKTIPPTTTTTTTTTPKPTTTTTGGASTLKFTKKPAALTTSTSRPSMATISTKPGMKTTTRPAIVSTQAPTTTSTKSTSLAFRTTTVPTTTLSNIKSPSTILSRMDEIPSHQPPTGMQGLLSLLDASLGSIFQNEDPMGRPQLNERVGTRNGAIVEELETVEERSAEKDEPEVDDITEAPPRGTRQIFDYDQLPDARLKQLMEDASNYEDEDTEDGKDWAKYTAYSDDEEDEFEDIMGEGIKRYGNLMDYEGDDNVAFGNKHKGNPEGKHDTKQNEDESGDEYEDEVGRRFKNGADVTRNHKL